MCRGVKGLPRDFRRLGYQDRLVENGFNNSNRHTVKPDLVIGSEKLTHSILFEWKKGANTEKEQLAHYSEVTENDLQNIALLPKNISSTYDICIVGKKEYEERIKIGLQSYSFPLLIVGRNFFQLALHNFKPAQLNEMFIRDLVIDFDQAPTSFIPFNEESEDWEIAEVVIQFIITQMAARKPNLFLEEMCNDLIPVWNMLGPQNKTEYRNKINHIVSTAAGHDFRRYLEKNITLKGRANTKVWDIKNNPLDMSSMKRSREFKKLENLQKNFIAALKNGRWPSYQTELFKDN